jgi:hypothetical protein
MGIKTEYNPDLALRPYQHFVDGKRLKEECVPEQLELGKCYAFLKKGQRVYWMEGEFPLVTTDGMENLSRPLASIQMKEVTHFLKENDIWTKGIYEVVEVFDSKSSKIHFEGFTRI